MTWSGGEMTFDGSRYFIETSTAQNLVDSRNTCSARGMDLAVFETRDEWTMMHAILYQQLGRSFTSDIRIGNDLVDLSFKTKLILIFWIGLIQNDPGPGYDKWINGASVTYNYWKSTSEPGCSTGPCETFIEGDSNYAWNALSSGSVKYSLCEGAGK